MQPHSFSKRHLAATALMLDEEGKTAALSDTKLTWVHKLKNKDNLVANR
jgi:hypothetical protein